LYTSQFHRLGVSEFDPGTKSGNLILSIGSACKARESFRSLRRFNFESELRTQPLQFLRLVINVQFRKRVFVALVLPVVLWAAAEASRAQSSDQSLPTPVLANEINGKIAALDLGDARLTRHFYAFEGNPGDLLITMDSRNLNGDIDVFTAVTFRPLMKTSIYASSQPPLGVTKGIYLRTHQILILRVEARSPSDEGGTYHVRFGGSFAPFSGGIPVAENTEPEGDAATRRGTKRLSSVGATIAEPVVETPPTAAETKPAENAAEKPAEDTAASKKPAAGKAKPRRSTARSTRGRTPRPARPKPATPGTETAKTAETKPEETKTSEAKTDEPKKEADAGEKKPAADSAKSETPAKPSTQEVTPPGAHLIIESKDGTKIDRPMSTVRRVVVEGGMIVVVLKTGKIERIPMSTVARMAIEP
jgi:hypothetical protein